MKQSYLSADIDGAPTYAGYLNPLEVNWIAWNDLITATTSTYLSKPRMSLYQWSKHPIICWGTSKLFFTSENLVLEAPQPLRKFFFTISFFFQLMEEVNFAAEIAKLFQISNSFWTITQKFLGSFKNCQHSHFNHVRRKISL